MHVSINAGPHARFLTYLAFVHALVTNNSNIYRIYVDVDQVLTFVAEPPGNQLWDPAAADDAAKSKKLKNLMTWEGQKAKFMSLCLEHHAMMQTAIL